MADESPDGQEQETADAPGRAEALDRHPDYRGPEAAALGAAIARDGVLDARVVGEAVATGRYDGQLLKRVWHLVARFGSPTPD